VTPRYLITGGAGVVGKEMIKLLDERGAQYRIIDRLPAVPGVRDYVQAELSTIDSSVISSFDPEIIIHLAASFERSVEHADFWESNARDNVLASQKVLQAACESPSLRRYVFASSYLVYNEDQYKFAEPPDQPTRLHETSELRPRNVCGVAKLLHEMEAELAAEDDAVNFSVASARIYRVYGPGSRDVISRWIRSCLSGEEIDVYGEESLFDYVHARDVANGLLRLADSQVSGPVNLATGSARRVADVLACLKPHFPEATIHPSIPAPEYEASQADIARLEEATGWKPEVSLERGVAELVAYETAEADKERQNPRTADPVNLNVLLTSISRKSGLVSAARQAITALTMTGEVWAGDLNPEAPARIEADGFWQMPRTDELSAGDLVTFCKSKDIRLIIPTRDGELATFAKMREHLAGEGILLSVSSSETIELCDDKLAFANFLTGRGLPSIETAVDVTELNPTSSYVAKERRGAGAASIGFGSAEAVTKHAEDLTEAVFQPCVDGTEFSIDVFCDQNGSCLGAVPRERTLIHAGESQVTTLVDSAPLAELARSVAEAVDLRGHGVIQAIGSLEDNSFQILECNARVGGASSLSFAAGLRSIDFLVEEASGFEATVGPIRLEGMQMVRLPEDHFEWTA